MAFGSWPTPWRNVERELTARLAYACERQAELGRLPGLVKPTVAEALTGAVALVRQAIEGRQREQAEAALDELEEHLAELSSHASQVNEEQAVETALETSLASGFAEARARLAHLRQAGIGQDGLAILDARLDRATGTSRAPGELEAVRSALTRLEQRLGHKLTQN